MDGRKEGLNEGRKEGRKEGRADTLMKVSAVVKLTTHVKRSGKPLASYPAMRLLIYFKKQSECRRGKRWTTFVGCGISLMLSHSWTQGVTL